jgi:hypothetical protein
MKGVGSGIDNFDRLFSGDPPGLSRSLSPADVSDVFVRRAGVRLGDTGNAVIGHDHILSGILLIPGKSIWAFPIMSIYFSSKF